MGISRGAERMRSKVVATGLAGLVFLGLGVGAGLRVGRAQSGVGARVGEKLDEVGRGIVRGAQDVSDAVRKRFEVVKSDVSRMGVQPRVYSRLHWDKTLHDSRVEVHMLRDGGVLLRGTVPDEAARSHAVALARDTHGVTAVVDELAAVVPTAVPDATTTVTPAAGTTTTTTIPGSATVPALTKPR
jgi:hyperosmotically inducible periplasmic protein